MRAQLEGLDEANAEAWRIYRHLASRFVVDFNLGAELLRRVTREWPVDELLDLVQRLGVIYDELNPPPPRGT